MCLSPLAILCARSFPRHFRKKAGVSSTAHVHAPSTAMTLVSSPSVLFSLGISLYLLVAAQAWTLMPNGPFSRSAGPVACVGVCHGPSGSHTLLWTASSSRRGGDCVSHSLANAWLLPSSLDRQWGPWHGQVHYPTARSCFLEGVVPLSSQARALA